MSDLDDQVIFDLRSKLRLDTNTFDEGNAFGYSGGIEDEDIIMKDYTEDDVILIDEKEELVGDKQDTIQTMIQVAEGEGEEKEEKEEDAKMERSIIPRIFRPQDEGFHLGKVNALQAQDDNELVQSYEGMIGDKPVVIHNHYYHINNEKEDTEEIHTDAVNKNLIIIKGFKDILNYSIILSISYFVIVQIWKDIRNEYREFEINREIMKGQCLIDYTNNKCDIYGQLPALKEECLNWLICINEGNSGYLKNLKKSQLGVSIIGKLTNELLDKISNLNKLFILGVLVIWYSGNFAYGYVKGLSSREGKQKVD